MPARLAPLSLCLLLAGCSVFEEGGPVLLDGPYTDYDAFQGAERPPFPSLSNRLLHFDGTRYLLSFRVECATLPVDSVQAVELLRLERGVDVATWVLYHHADFGNEYADIEPERYALRSGTARLTDVEVEEVMHRYWTGEEVTATAVRYRLEAEALVFDGARVPSVRTERHTCFAGDGFGRPARSRVGATGGLRRAPVERF